MIYEDMQEIEEAKAQRKELMKVLFKFQSQLGQFEDNQTMIDIDEVSDLIAYKIALLQHHIMLDDINEGLGL